MGRGMEEAGANQNPLPFHLHPELRLPAVPIGATLELADSATLAGGRGDGKQSWCVWFGLGGLLLAAMSYPKAVQAG